MVAPAEICFALFNPEVMAVTSWLTFAWATTLNKLLFFDMGGTLLSVTLMYKAHRWRTRLRVGRAENREESMARNRITSLEEIAGGLR